jgi:ssDNA thymidine ADP-ribosyltransferase, DarT
LRVWNCNSSGSTARITSQPSSQVGVNMATSVQEFVQERGIKGLFHFTRAGNLGSILQRGLITRDTLLREGNVAACNDSYRLDNTNAVCLSIAFPNYKMFWSLRERTKQQGVDWIILAIRPAALWELPAAFCRDNAAAASVTAILLEQRRSLDAFKAMYGDFDEKKRTALPIKDDFPTNPQAEVLMLNGVPRSYILGALVLNNQVKEKLGALHSGLEFRVNAGYFRYRTDFEHWKKMS